MTTRRGFLGAILAAGVAPIYVKAGILMPVRQIVVSSEMTATEVLMRQQAYLRRVTELIHEELRINPPLIYSGNGLFQTFMPPDQPWFSLRATI